MCEWRRNDEKCETLVVVGACNPAPSPASIQPRIFRQAAARANQRFLRPRLDQSRQGLTILQNRRSSPVPRRGRLYRMAHSLSPSIASIAE